mmetsp:Transcript_30401/g.59440  ORF Transcript_30401/g.59440 Transcript_30401/m.59440 type:complete len:402 (-) Transcript_30401:40-1245(-)
MKNLVFVSSYTRFNNLAHQPRGKESKFGIYTFDLNVSSGELVLLSVTQDDVSNPSFFRWHPNRRVLYTVTESIKEKNHVVAYSVDQDTGVLKKIGQESSGGTSSCYITLTRSANKMLVVNYWDSTLGILPLNPDGTLNSLRSVTEMPDKKHGIDQSAHLEDRQSEPHSHSLVLDPFFEKVAFVPDLGTDSIRQFVYCDNTGSLEYINSIPALGMGSTKTGNGPRYIVFHPSLGTAYVINELSNSISVFKWDQTNFEAIVSNKAKVSALTFVQNISTLPIGFDCSLSKAGRVCISQNGRFVLASNRGHDSITTFEIAKDGLLTSPRWCHTHGETPRHFQFDNSGQWCIAVGQDEDAITILKFNSGTGELKYTGLTYKIPSPNFVSAEYSSFPYFVQTGASKL